eukprot:CAMPEP_0115040860 /NCGR_PEP_ID=MMETSP0216-20121206/45128_1 /TAXON_ID=223996 /ORGANISM="Protocruzia adherens, Strain Boccale" /LENGTH=88 /DNA_ID=CAMNT_0002422277 /DNA_START=11 /DNA_END=277 /DNA_ORIENTATION=-
MTVYFWIFVKLSLASEAHSGYNFPWSPLKFLPLTAEADFHNYHHSHNMGNYSATYYIWDEFGGTQLRWLQFTEQKRRLSVTKKRTKDM